MMTRENGQTVAEVTGWANEKKGDWTHNQEEGERQMDDYNNQCGRNYGNNANSTQDCANSCMGAATSGQLQTYTSGSTSGYWD